MGGTVGYFLPHARRIVSVEIEPRLYEAAQHRFRSSPSVELVLGDALEEIPRVLAGVSDPPLVYLDGHFTGGVNTEPGRFVEPAPGSLAGFPFKTVNDRERIPGLHDPLDRHRGLLLRTM